MKLLLTFLLLIIYTNLFAQINFKPLINHNEKDTRMVKLSEKLIVDVINSNCFEDFFLKRKLRKTNGRSNKEVIEHLRSLKGDVPVRMYYSRKNVVGYRQPPSIKVHTNLKYHRGANLCNRSSNLSHEAYGHSLGGYGHAFRPNKLRPFTVPYSLNEAFKVCCSCTKIDECKVNEKIIKPKYKTVCKKTWYTLWLSSKCKRIRI